MLKKGSVGIPNIEVIILERIIPIKTKEKEDIISEKNPLTKLLKKQYLIISILENPIKDKIAISFLYSKNWM